MKDDTAESGIVKADSSKAEVVHGVPDFYRDETTGTILYNVQDEDGNGTEQYISEAEPGLIIDYSKLEDAPEYEIKYKTKAAKISEKYSDLKYIKPGRASNDSIRYSDKVDNPIDSLKRRGIINNVVKSSLLKTVTHPQERKECYITLN